MSGTATASVAKRQRATLLRVETRNGRTWCGSQYAAAFRTHAIRDSRAFRVRELLRA